MQSAVAPFPALLEPPEELEPPLPDDPPDELPPLPEPAAAACAVTVTFTLTVFVAVTVGAGSGDAVSVAVAVAVTVAVGRTLSAASFASVPLSWPLDPAPMPRKKARPTVGNTYRFRAHLGAVLTGGCGAVVYGLLMCPPRVLRRDDRSASVKLVCGFRAAVTYSRCPRSHVVIELTGFACSGTIPPTRPGNTGDGEMSLDHGKTAGRPEQTAHCDHCDQDVKPVEHNGWRNFLAWLALLEFGAVIAAIVAAINPYAPDSAGGGIGRLILWPAAVHPAWLAISAAIVAFLAAAILSGKAGERAAKKATCPNCGLHLGAERPSAATA